MSNTLTLAKITALSALVAMARFANAGTELDYLEKPLANRVVKLPVLPGFLPACEEDPQFAQRAALMSPKNTLFLTCLVDSRKWRDFRDGRSINLYPFVAVTVALPHPSGDFTPDDFQNLKAATRAQLGNLLADNQYAKRQIAAQDKKLSKVGTEVHRRDYQEGLQGFFEPIGGNSSFSYVVSRSATVSEGGVTRGVREMNAVSTILYSGRLLLLNVVDQPSDSAQGLTVQEITSRWLHAFRRFNEASEK
ncbi:MAG TPA: hypothetical protein PLW86_17390 [Rhodocyclaceae bacterium]|nr:hypothetical protein [Rhodocyclaceae bacterium]